MPIKHDFENLSSDLIPSNVCLYYLLRWFFKNNFLLLQATIFIMKQTHQWQMLAFIRKVTKLDILICIHDLSVLSICALFSL